MTTTPESASPAAPRRRKLVVAALALVVALGLAAWYFLRDPWPPEAIWISPPMAEVVAPGGPIPVVGVRPGDESLTLRAQFRLDPPDGDWVTDSKIRLNAERPPWDRVWGQTHRPPLGVYLPTDTRSTDASGAVWQRWTLNRE